MSDTNIVVEKGRLVRNADLKYTGAGTPCTSFSIAVNEAIKNKQSGEYQNRPSYFDVTLWGNYGKAVIQYLTKGREVLVSGRLRQDRWDGNDGSKNSKVQIIASNVEILREPKGNADAGNKMPPQQNAYDAAQDSPDGYAAAPDDAPFF